MADYQLDSSFNVESEAKGFAEDIERQLIENYMILENCSRELEALGLEIKEIKVSIRDLICDSAELMERFQGFISRFMDIASQVSSIRIRAEMQRFYLFGIVMKKAQIIMLKVKRMQAVMKKRMTEDGKKIVLEAQNGKINISSSITAAITAALTAMAPTFAAILTAMDVILQLLAAVTAMSVEGDGMAFFPTVKSIKATGIDIPNLNKSCNDFIPEAVKTAITNAETAAEQALANAKNEILMSKEGLGASLAAMASVTGFDIGAVSLPKIDVDAMITAVNVIIQSIIGAEALPRYESLVPWNVKWMIFLLGGFEVAMKKTFGLPGYP